MCDEGGMLTNCTLTGNSAPLRRRGVSGTLNHCTLTGNLAADSGGGAHSGTLNDCTLSANSASYGGGATQLYPEQLHAEWQLGSLRRRRGLCRAR